MSKRRIASLFAFLLSVAAVLLVAFNAQYIKDRVVYHQYEPSAAIASLVDESGMGDHGRFLFYTSQPSLENAEMFNQHCEKREKTTAILGCYDGQNIYIYDIDDPRLAGIRPTTAAHEMLHAAYQRLGDKDRQMVDGLLNAEYENLKDDKELASRMAFYARTQPGDRENELHSIIGTEVAEIGPALEEYYRRYFVDRSMVVAQRQQYYTVFEDLRLRAEELRGQIDKLGKQVQSQRVSYDREAQSLQAAIASFNSRARQGDFTNQFQFNTERQGLVARTESLERLSDSIYKAIDEYNILVAELNDIATETNELNSSLDSNLEPAPSIQEGNG